MSMVFPYEIEVIFRIQNFIFFQIILSRSYNIFRNKNFNHVGSTNKSKYYIEVELMVKAGSAVNIK